MRPVPLRVDSCQLKGHPALCAGHVPTNRKLALRTLNMLSQRDHFGGTALGRTTEKFQIPRPAKRDARLTH